MSKNDKPHKHNLVMRTQIEKIEASIIKRLMNKTFSFRNGERSFYGYTINVFGLEWCRNLIDGVQIEIAGQSKIVYEFGTRKIILNGDTIIN